MTLHRRDRERERRRVKKQIRAQSTSKNAASSSSSSSDSMTDNSTTNSVRHVIDIQLHSCDQQVVLQQKDAIMPGDISPPPSRPLSPSYSDSSSSSLFPFSHVLSNDRHSRLESVSRRLNDTAPPSQKPNSNTNIKQITCQKHTTNTLFKQRHGDSTHSNAADAAASTPLAVKFSMGSLLLLLVVFLAKGVQNEYFPSSHSADARAHTHAFAISSSSSSSSSATTAASTSHLPPSISARTPQFAFMSAITFGAIQSDKPTRSVRSSPHTVPPSNSLEIVSFSHRSSSHELVQFDAASNSTSNSTAVVASSSSTKFCPPVHTFPHVDDYDSYLTQGAFILPALGLAYILAAMGLLQTRYLDPWARWVSETRGYGSRQGEALLLNIVGILPQLFIHTIALMLTNRDMGLGTVIGSTVSNLFLFTLGVVWLCSAAKPALPFTLGWFRASRDSFAFSLGILLVVSVTISGGEISYAMAIPVIAGLIGYAFLFHKSWDLYQWAARGVDRATVVLNSTDPELNQYQGLIAFLEGNLFSAIINLIICFSVVCVIWDELTGPSWLVSVNYGFSTIFILECVIKHFAYGVFGYWKEPLNAFDGVLVTLIMFEFIFSSGNIAGSVRVVRLFRFLRALRGMRAIRVTRGISFRNGTFHFAKQSSRKSKSEAELAKIAALQKLNEQNSTNALSVNGVVSEHGDKSFVVARAEGDETNGAATGASTGDAENEKSVKRSNTSRRRASMTDAKSPTSQDALQRQKTASRNRRASLMPSGGSHGSAGSEGSGKEDENGMRNSPRSHSKRGSVKRMSTIGLNSPPVESPRRERASTFTAVPASNDSPSIGSMNSTSVAAADLTAASVVPTSPVATSPPGSPRHVRSSTVTSPPNLGLASPSASPPTMTITSSSNTTDGHTPRRRSSVARSLTQYSGRHKRSHSEKNPPIAIAEEPEGNLASPGSVSPRHAMGEFMPIDSSNDVTNQSSNAGFATPIRIPHAPAPLSPILQSPSIHQQGSSMESNHSAGSPVDAPDIQRSPSLGDDGSFVSRSDSPIASLDAGGSTLVTTTNVPPRKPSLLIRTSTFSPAPAHRLSQYPSHSQMGSPSIIHSPVSVFQPIFSSDAAFDEKQQHASVAQPSSNANSSLFVAAPPAASGSSVQRLPSLRIASSFMVNSSPSASPPSTTASILPTSQPVFVAAPAPKIRIPGRGGITGSSFTVGGAFTPVIPQAVTQSPKFTAIQSSTSDAESKEPSTPVSTSNTNSNNKSNTPRSSRIRQRHVTDDSPQLEPMNSSDRNVKINVLQQKEDSNAVLAATTTATVTATPVVISTIPARATTAPASATPTKKILLVRTPRGPGAATFKSAAEIVAEMDEKERKKAEKNSQILQEQYLSLHGHADAQSAGSDEMSPKKKPEPGSRLLLQNRLHHVEDEAAEAAAEKQQQHARMNSQQSSLPISAPIQQGSLNGVQLVAMKPTQAPHHAATPSNQSVFSDNSESAVEIHHLPHHSIASFDGASLSPAPLNSGDESHPQHELRHAASSNSAIAPVHSPVNAKRVAPAPIGGLRSNSFYMQSLGLMVGNNNPAPAAPVDPAKAKAIEQFNRSNRRASLTRSTTFTAAPHSQLTPSFKGSLKKASKLLGESEDTTITFVQASNVKKELKDASNPKFNEGVAQIDPRLIIMTQSFRNLNEGNGATAPPKRVATAIQFGRVQTIQNTSGRVRSESNLQTSLEETPLGSSDDDDESYSGVSRQGTIQTASKFIPIGASGSHNNSHSNVFQHQQQSQQQQQQQSTPVTAHKKNAVHRNTSMGPRLQTITSAATKFDNGGESGRGSPNSSAGEREMSRTSNRQVDSREVSESEYSSHSYSYTYSYSFDSNIDSRADSDSDSSSSSDSASNSESSNNSEASLDSNGEKVRRVRRRKIRAWSVVPRKYFHVRSKIGWTLLFIMMCIVIAALALQVRSLLDPPQDDANLNNMANSPNSTSIVTASIAQTLMAITTPYTETPSFDPVG